MSAHDSLRPDDAQGIKNARVATIEPDEQDAEHWMYSRRSPIALRDDALIDALAEALVDVWVRLGLPLAYRALAAE